MRVYLVDRPAVEKAVQEKWDRFKSYAELSDNSLRGDILALGESIADDLRDGHPWTGEAGTQKEPHTDAGNASAALGSRCVNDMSAITVFPHYDLRKELMENEWDDGMIRLGAAKIPNGDVVFTYTVNRGGYRPRSVFYMDFRDEDGAEGVLWRCLVSAVKPEAPWGEVNDLPEERWEPVERFRMAERRREDVAKRMVWWFSNA